MTNANTANGHAPTFTRGSLTARRVATVTVATVGAAAILAGAAHAETPPGNPGIGVDIAGPPTAIAPADASQDPQWVDAARIPLELLSAILTEVASKPAAAPVSAGRLGQVVAPTVGTLTSPFGDGRGHQGIDIANDTGTPILAIASGKVISAGPADGFGLWVRIEHGDGTVTTYGHNDTNLVKVGQKVVAGQKIATVGNRGNSSGPHLHFEVAKKAGTTVDPLPWLRQRGVVIEEPADLAGQTDLD